MAAARPESVDLLGDFEEDEKLPWKLSTKQTVKLKLQSNILANRKSFELWNATFRADIGKYVVFLETMTCLLWKNGACLNAGEP